MTIAISISWNVVRSGQRRTTPSDGPAAALVILKSRPRRRGWPPAASTSSKLPAPQTNFPGLATGFPQKDMAMGVPSTLSASAFICGRRRIEMGDDLIARRKGPAQCGKVFGDGGDVMDRIAAHDAETDRLTISQLIAADLHCFPFTPFPLVRALAGAWHAGAKGTIAGRSGEPSRSSRNALGSIPDDSRTPPGNDGRRFSCREGDSSMLRRSSVLVALLLATPGAEPVDAGSQGPLWQVRAGAATVPGQPRVIASPAGVFLETAAGKAGPLPVDVCYSCAGGARYEGIQVWVMVKYGKDKWGGDNMPVTMMFNDGRAAAVLFWSTTTIPCVRRLGMPMTASRPSALFPVVQRGEGWSLTLRQAQGERKSCKLPIPLRLSLSKSFRSAWYRPLASGRRDAHAEVLDLHVVIETVV
ncbi:hypothetical protein [Novosphingobium resinovorum]|uniref:hypothetical protein n=1 Tax=Novosphingobium resinovorum TaxID=158500 RepID=UPI003D268970